MNKDYCQTFEDNDCLKETNNDKDRETLSEINIFLEKSLEKI